MIIGLKNSSIDKEIDLDNVNVSFNIMSKRIMNPPTYHSSEFKDFLSKYGDKKITSITIGKKPISDMNRLILNILMIFNPNASDYKKKMIDKPMYHTFLLITIEGVNKIIRLEHNNTFIYLCFQHKLSNEEMKKREMTFKSVDIAEKKFTLKSLISKAESKSGPQFFQYSIRKNNCQTFVYRILGHNNLMTEDLYNFTVQNVDDIFKDINFNVNFKVGELNLQDFYNALVHGK